MAVVSVSHFNLIKSRKRLQGALSSRDWTELRGLDAELQRSLNAAFDDPERDPQALVNEVERILQTYVSLVNRLCVDGRKKLSPSNQ